MDEIHPNELFTGHFYYLEYQNPKHFALGILGVMKIIEFPCEIISYFRKWVPF
jgi:hypothetical protein